MKLVLQFCGGLVALALAASAFGQGTFQNLGFESANLPVIPSGQYGSLEPASAALPFWNAYLGTNQLAQVLHNNFLLGTANISVLGPNWTFTGTIEGSYSVLLQPGLASDGVSHLDAMLGQSATIPLTAQSLRFTSDAFPHSWKLSIGGQSLPVVRLSSTAQLAYYGVDILSFAGFTGELKITALYNPLDNGSDFLDAIAFSPQPIPEPGVFSMVGLGALLLGWRLSRKARA